MGMDTFRKALDLCSEYVTLGGGEPTIHPDFEKILLEAIGHENITEQGVHIITNGKHTGRALVLARLAKNKVISAELSTDKYHEKIDDKVYVAFPPDKHMQRDITKGGTRSPIVVGRWMETEGLEPEDCEEEDCCCPEYIVDPDGTIKQCGCPDSPSLGNVNETPNEFFGYAHGMCHRSIEHSEAFIEFENRHAPTV
jgi:MoaA/NifB/PqqE/SkfB family radical SAM enzyme